MSGVPLSGGLETVHGDVVKKDEGLKHGDKGRKNNFVEAKKGHTITGIGRLRRSEA